MVELESTGSHKVTWTPANRDRSLPAGPGYPFLGYASLARTFPVPCGK